MADIGDLRDGTAAVLDTISGLNAYPYVPGSLTPDAAVVADVNPSYDDTFEGDGHEYEFTVYIVVAHSSDQHAQRRIDDYLSFTGPRSVYQALKADRTLGGSVSDSRVLRAELKDLRTGEGTVYLSAELEMSALALRT